ncbi:putative 3-beta hydroxysteroid dehydrogenase [Vibrio nigripulchritudo SO65]|uniref:NAD-dependent epimerase/dehydratase family protein n=1 Tax=Vibrio nigripulchritudo TaxID=28173 RepID=UPI0003B223C9|nr:NAD(P)-dependent oxidoreductase [Vibrio nigripulchritudo]CCN36300.1 putative 3-beta hydroxysteroid dehydrogenase [Vibrio nigripulchritudo AM115]CCN39392.1 putative 3-beta hydroxysteroid dehydrogenase [Vibrio nigripulchritudo FTn2]CCN63511.1 putative 3-beta hydroxysteroid dehydrogenase [Vibrio nigripulchritudo POn4]CCN78073.1 putative 3-beta hydroxysteroid dehydrogenase [Vibrio nigripulchritudo SO65]
MRILVTGGTGMLGSAILRMYHQQHDLSFLGRNQTIAENLTQKYGVTAHIGDLSNKAVLRAACENVDAIIHTAALSSPWGTYQEFYQANVAGTQNLLEAATEAQVKTFIHISTTSVYFDETDRWSIKESDSVASKFCNDYAKTKYQAEQLVQSSPVHSVILRPRGIFGPNDRAIVPRVMNAIRGQTLLLPSSRNPVLDLTYVDNVAEAALLSCEKAEQIDSGTLLNISNDQPMPVEHILSELFSQSNMTIKMKGLPYPILLPILTFSEWVRDKLPNRPEPKITRYSAGLFHYHQTLDISRAKALLGYQPKISIKEGIQRYVSWRENQIV